jgi:radical SAM superfamily enzyme YgiQ (UPF0313 family)
MHSRITSSSSLKAEYRKLASRESGVIIKDAGGRLPVAVVYPSSYKIGMSNLGFHQLYRLLGKYPETLAERFFWQGAHLPALSLETFTPLAGFPLVLFSVSWEMDYFNIPAVLRTGGLPLYARDRADADPIVIAGGACIMSNPAPVAPFFDCLAIGEAEVLLPEIVRVAGDAGLSRQEKLAALAALPGMLVPGYSGTAPVRRMVLADLDAEPCHTAVIAPDSEFGNMYMVEVQRGCGRGCAFCMVNRVFSPLRFRSLTSLLATAREGLEHRPHIALVGPLVSAHPAATELVAGIRALGGQVSTSSMPVKPLSVELLREISLSGTQSVTLAPEAGTFRLRRSIGKHFTDDEILHSVSKVLEAGFSALKLYFMAGLPGETAEDIAALKDLVLLCRKAFGRKSLSINIAPFVPKPFTEFEREAFAPLEALEERLSFLRKELGAVGVRVKVESPAWSRVQAVLSRGDERLAPVISGLEKLTLGKWRRALADAGICDDEFLGKLPAGKKLPWEQIHHS